MKRFFAWNGFGEAPIERHEVFRQKSKLFAVLTEMYPLITFSYKGDLLGEPILDKQ